MIYKVLTMFAKSTVWEWCVDFEWNFKEEMVCLWTKNAKSAGWDKIFYIMQIIAPRKHSKNPLK